MEPFPNSQWQFVSLWLGGVTVMFAGAALLRRAQRLPFFRPAFPDVELLQTWRSGMSSVGLLGGLGRANNCLWFALTRDVLHVGAHFPFNMFMPRFVFGLDLTIPVATISSVSERMSFWGGGHVRVEYKLTDPTRGIVSTEYVDLWPRHGDRFFSILHDKVVVARQRRTV